MRAFIVLLVTLSLSAVAKAAPNNYTLDMSLTVDGKLVGEPRIQVEGGKLASIVKTQNDRIIFIDAIATEASSDERGGILMDFTIGKILKDGTRKVLSAPKIIGLAGEEATIEIGDKAEPKILRLAVVATRD